jgi:pyruvate/2-oxoglutarate dehydrogenase complex dihydrolipoamide dehydrogenase (E3) component
MSPDSVSSKTGFQTSAAEVDRTCRRNARIVYAKHDCARAMDLAHKLTFQLRAAEERVQELEVEAAHFRERATRAEDWLQHIHREVEQTFFQKKESGGSRQTRKK